MDIVKQIDGWVESAEDQILRFAKASREIIEPRRFKGEELCRLTGISSMQRIYDAEADGRLPPGDRDSRGIRTGYTLPQALDAMKLFKTLPGRKAGDPPVVLSFTNFKGGCWKTTSAHYFATWAATQGYQVLAIDLDPQASLTRSLGLLPDMETSFEHTLAPILSKSEAASADNLRKVIKGTHLPTLDLIPSSLDLQVVEWELSRNAIDSTRNDDAEGQLETFLILRRAIELLVDEYDLVVIDGTPTLGLIPLNIILASDGVVVPVPTEMADFCSTVSFLRILGEHLDQLIGAFGERIAEPELLFLPTRFAPGSNTTMGAEYVLNMIGRSFGSRVISTVIKKHDSVVSNLSLLSRTVFDSNPGEGGIKPDSRKRAAANYSQAFDEIMRRLVFPRWPQKLVELELKEIVRG